MEKEILKALSQVQEPDLGKDLVTLNMVKDIVVAGKKVSFTVVLTTPACPMKEHIKNACVNAVHHLVDKTLEVEVSFTSQTVTNRQEAKFLPKVKNIVAVFSGKGGVGKSTISSNLALSLQQQGAKVGLMDADIYGPSIPLMFGVRGERPKIIQIDGKNKIVPLEKYGIKLMSIGLLIDDKQAVVWRGPMASSAIKQFMTDVEWEDLDYLVIDMPPGTGDIHLTLIQSIQISGAVIITTPQKVAVTDAKKAIAMFFQTGIKVPIVGIVENMAYFTPKEFPDKKYYIFGKDGGKNLSEEFEVPFLGQIPIVESICEQSDLGTPIMVSEDTITQKAFQNFSSLVVRELARKTVMTP